MKTKSTPQMIIWEKFAAFCMGLFATSILLATFEVISGRNFAHLVASALFGITGMIVSFLLWRKEKHSTPAAPEHQRKEGK